MSGNAIKPAAANARALRIAGVDPERDFAGGESQVLGLTLALMRKGHCADLICDPAGALWQRARARGVTCYPLRIRNSVDAAAGLKLRTLLAHNHYDIVHFHTARAHALAPFAWGRARALIVTRRMDYAPNRLFAPWLYNRAIDGVAAISPAVADALVSSGVARDRIVIIPSGVDCDRFRSPTSSERASARRALQIAPNQVTVGTVGMLEPRKGQRYLIDAMALLSASRNEAGCTAASSGVVAPVSAMRCFIAGGGSLAAALSARIAENRLGDSTRLIGMIDDPRALLWALDMFVMPSLHEGLGVAVLEAMACGLPIVASATGGLAQTVADGITGILKPAGNARLLAQAIARLAAEPELREAMGAAGRARVIENYSIDAMAHGTLELYWACLHNRASSRR